MKFHTDHEKADCHELINDRIRSHAALLESITRSKFPNCKERLRKIVHRSRNFTLSMESELLILEEREAVK